MGTSKNTAFSWTEPFKRWGGRALATAMGVLGLITLSPTETPPTPSPVRASPQTDPVSPDGHYATWTDYLVSIECNAQRRGLGWPKNEPIPGCSRFFKAVQAANRIETGAPHPVDPVQSPSPAYSPSRTATDESAPPNALSPKALADINAAYTQIKTNNPDLKYKGYTTILDFLGDIRPRPSSQRDAIFEIVGREDQFYRDLDVFLVTYGNTQEATLAQQLWGKNLQQLSRDETCTIRDPLNTYADILLSRLNLRQRGDIKDSLVGYLEGEYTRVQTMSNQLNNRGYVICASPGNGQAPTGP